MAKGELPQHTSSAWDREERLRQAEISFITDRTKRGLEYWWEHSRCHEVLSLQVLFQRAKVGRWDDRRAQFWSEVTQEVLKSAKTKAVNDRVSDLLELQQVRQSVLQLILPVDKDGVRKFAVKPGSLEGMIGAFAKIDKLADDKRDAVLLLIEPMLLTAAQGDPEQQSTLTPDEHRELAHHILRRRLLSAAGAQNNEAHQVKDTAQGPAKKPVKVSVVAAPKNGTREDES